MVQHMEIDPDTIVPMMELLFEDQNVCGRSQQTIGAVNQAEEVISSQIHNNSECIDLQNLVADISNYAFDDGFKEGVHAGIKLFRSLMMI